MTQSNVLQDDKPIQLSVFGRTINVPDDELTWKLEDNGQVVALWDQRLRTNHVLDRFPPADGWAIRLSSQYMGFDMDDANAFAHRIAGEVASTDKLWPAYRFTAELVNPRGDIVATASTLRVIKGQDAWEAGENNARNRLYEAIGLRGAFRYEPTAAAIARLQPAGNGTSTATASAAVAATTASESGIRPVTGPEGSFSRRDRTPANASPAPAASAEPTAVDTPSQDASTEATAPAAAIAASPDAGAEDSSTNAASDQDTAEEPVSPQLLRLIQKQCQNRNIEVPAFKNQAEASAYLAGMQRKGNGRSNGAEVH